MRLIADSGSTKTDWVLTATAGGAPVAGFQTQGITPVHQSAGDIRDILNGELTAALQGACRKAGLTVGDLDRELTDVSFYGSGCTPDRIPLMQQLLGGRFPQAAVEVQSDLMAAARALCGRSEGIACILGTGANSGLYDGRQVVKNTPAMGYVLGDEGSGAVLGRLFLNAIFKTPACAALRDAYLAEEQLTLADVIRRVYREPVPSRFLASTSLFIRRHMEQHAWLEQLVTDNFRSFFRANIVPYGRRDLPVSFVGSMAAHYEPQLRRAAADEGFAVGTVAQRPMDGLLTYHAL